MYLFMNTRLQTATLLSATRRPPLANSTRGEVLSAGAHSSKIPRGTHMHYNPPVLKQQIQIPTFMKGNRRERWLEAPVVYRIGVG